MADNPTDLPVNELTPTSSSSSAGIWDFNSSSTTTPEASTLISTSKYCYSIDPFSSDDTVVNVLFIVFLVLCLTSIIWRIISGIQMIRRYEGKIKILTSGPILDKSYFEGGDAAPKTAPQSQKQQQQQQSQKQQQQSEKQLSQPEQNTPLLNNNAQK